MPYHHGSRASGAVYPWVVAASLVFLFLAFGCKQREEQGAPLAVAIHHGSVTDILPRIALEQGYFSEEGLRVTLKDLPDGKQAFNNMLKGECNFAISGAPPIVLADPQATPFAILATVLSDDDPAKIIARRDRGIAGPQDLKGKRIGVKQGIIGHLFLDLFMQKHGLGHNEVVQVFMEPDQFQAALESGGIDGFSMTNKMVSGAAKALGSKSVVFAEPGLVPMYGILTTRLDLPANRQAAPRVLKALLRAEQYAKREPAAAKGLVAKTAMLSAREIEDVWSRSTIEVALANVLFLHLEDQYRWQVERGDSSLSAAMPNYLNLFSPEYLRAIKPEAVSVIKR